MAAAFWRKILSYDKHPLPLPLLASLTISLEYAISSFVLAGKAFAKMAVYVRKAEVVYVKIEVTSLCLGRWFCGRAMPAFCSDAATLSGSSSFSSTNWTDRILATSLAGIGGKLEANEKGVDTGGGTTGGTTKDRNRGCPRGNEEWCWFHGYKSDKWGGWRAQPCWWSATYGATKAMSERANHGALWLQLACNKGVRLRKSPACRGWLWEAYLCL